MASDSSNPRSQAEKKIADSVADLLNAVHDIGKTEDGISADLADRIHSVTRAFDELIALMEDEIKAAVAGKEANLKSYYSQLNANEKLKKALAMVVSALAD